MYAHKFVYIYRHAHNSKHCCCYLVVELRFYFEFRSRFSVWNWTWTALFPFRLLIGKQWLTCCLPKETDIAINNIVKWSEHTKKYCSACKQIHRRAWCSFATRSTNGNYWQPFLIYPWNISCSFIWQISNTGFLARFRWIDSLFLFSCPLETFSLFVTLYLIFFATNSLSHIPFQNFSLMHSIKFKMLIFHFQKVPECLSVLKEKNAERKIILTYHQTKMPLHFNSTLFTSFYCLQWRFSYDRKKVDSLFHLLIERMQRKKWKVEKSVLHFFL